MNTRPAGRARPCVRRRHRSQAFTVLDHDHFGRAIGHALGDPGVTRQLPVLAVHRHEETRPDQRDHELELLLAAVPGDVHVLEPFVHDLGTRAARCGSSRARSPARFRESRAPRTRRCRPRRASRGGDRRSRCARAPPAVRLASPSSCRRSGGGVVADVAVTDLQARPGSSGSRAAARSASSRHAAADERDLALELRREIDHDLHPVEAGRERGDDDLARRRR